MGPAGEKPRRRGLTIRLKLTLWYGCLFLLAGVLLIAINYFMVRDSLTPAPEKARAVVAERFGIPPAALEPEPFRPPGQPFEWQQYIEVDDIGVPVSGLDPRRRSTNCEDEALHQLWTKSLIALAIITVITFGLAWLVAGRMLRPLHAITSTARRLSGSTLHERIALKGPRDELKDLADTFDEMLGRLDTAFTAQKEFVANASHELRTPLTIIRTEIDVALSDPDLSPEELQEMGTAVTDAVDRSEHLIDGLLVLAEHGERPRPGRPRPGRGRGARGGPRLGEADALDLRLELDLQPAPIKGDRSLRRANGGQPRGERHPPQRARRLVLGEDRPGRRPGGPGGGKQRTGRVRRGSSALVRPLLPARQVPQPQDRRIRPGSLHRQVGRDRFGRLGGAWWRRRPEASTSPSVCRRRVRQVEVAAHSHGYVSSLRPRPGAEHLFRVAAHQAEPGHQRDIGYGVVGDVVEGDRRRGQLVR